MGQGCVWGTQQQDRGQWEQTGTQRAPSKHKEELLCCEGGRGLEQSPERGGGDSSFLELLTPAWMLFCAAAVGDLRGDLWSSAGGGRSNNTEVCANWPSIHTDLYVEIIRDRSSKY